jgi:hypothetical protein
MRGACRWLPAAAAAAAAAASTTLLPLLSTSSCFARSVLAPQSTYTGCLL